MYEFVRKVWRYQDTNIGIPKQYIEEAQTMQWPTEKGWIKHGPRFLCICRVLFVFNDFRGEAVVRFVDICGVLDHHFLSFLFTTLLFWDLSAGTTTYLSWRLHVCFAIYLAFAFIGPLSFWMNSNLHQRPNSLYPIGESTTYPISYWKLYFELMDPGSREFCHPVITFWSEDLSTKWTVPI